MSEENKNTNIDKMVTTNSDLTNDYKQSLVASSQNTRPDLPKSHMVTRKVGLFSKNDSSGDE